MRDPIVEIGVPALVTVFIYVFMIAWERMHVRLCQSHGKSPLAEGTRLHAVEKCSLLRPRPVCGASFLCQEDIPTVILPRLYQLIYKYEVTLLPS
ncbi:hypothetical protein C8P63_104146 [Melghirimyces profundicolus]|uniref:Uncharacterized protein n=1 Tax=Melghirimyces profundicolus TaxID=1242148 RepID=A0A2T6C4Q1_9BACL|nr:hypothetical protein C8P63_104146 [Melghirimyces profundicolus]